MPILKLLILLGQFLLFLLLFRLWGHYSVWFRIFSYLTCLFFNSSNPSPPLFHPFLSFFCCIFFCFLCWVVEGCAEDKCLCTPTLNRSLTDLWGSLSSFCLCPLVWTLFLLCVCVCSLMYRCAIPFQLCCSFTHLALHYAAFMLFLRCKLHFWGKEKWPIVPVITLNSVRVENVEEKTSEVK